MRYRLICAVVTLVLTAPLSAQLENVGNLSFPTSGSPEAQRHFLRGVAILHSFGWKQAITEFKRAQELQPDFAMAYWGETLCYNHPLNAEADARNPRAILSRLGSTADARPCTARQSMSASSAMVPEWLPTMRAAPSSGTFLVSKTSVRNQCL
jgi:hypothetical protein